MSSPLYSPFLRSGLLRASDPGGRPLEAACALRAPLQAPPRGHRPVRPRGLGLLIHLATAEAASRLDARHGSPRVSRLIGSPDVQPASLRASSLHPAAVCARAEARSSPAMCCASRVHSMPPTRLRPSGSCAARCPNRGPCCRCALQDVHSLRSTRVPSSRPLQGVRRSGCVRRPVSPSEDGSPCAEESAPCPSSAKLGSVLSPEDVFVPWRVADSPWLLFIPRRRSLSPCRGSPREALQRRAPRRPCLLCHVPEGR